MAETPLKVMGLSGSIGRTSKNGMLVDLALRKSRGVRCRSAFLGSRIETIAIGWRRGLLSHPNVKEFRNGIIVRCIPCFFARIPWDDVRCDEEHV